MNQMDKINDELNKIDIEMATLFEKRMKIVEDIALYKKDMGAPVNDKERSINQIDAAVNSVDFKYQPYYKEMLDNVIAVSQKYQHKLNEGMKIAYSGIEGAFAHIAALKIFNGGITVSYPDFSSAYKSVEKGECDCVVLPIENSYAGDVDTVFDLAYKGHLSVSGIYHLPLEQSLLAKEGTKLSDITEVVSHQQALMQCGPYLSDKKWKLTAKYNTAAAAREVSQSDRKDLAVIASRDAARIYGLKVLEPAINENKNNTTRFAVFTRQECSVGTNDNHFLMFFTTKDEPGSLGNAINVIGKYKFNLRSLKSRPTGNENWTYYFYTEGSGNLGTSNGKAMLNELSKTCENVRILGSIVEEKIL